MIKVALIDDDPSYMHLLSELSADVFESIAMYSKFPVDPAPHINIAICDLDFHHLSFDETVKTALAKFPNAYLVINSGAVHSYFIAEHYEERVLNWGAHAAYSKDRMNEDMLKQIKQDYILNK